MDVIKVPHLAAGTVPSIRSVRGCSTSALRVVARPRVDIGRPVGAPDTILALALGEAPVAPVAASGSVVCLWDVAQVGAPKDAVIAGILRLLQGTAKRYRAVELVGTGI